MKLALAALILISGCATQPPQSAEDLRRSVVAAKTHVFEVRRRHRDVAASLQRHAQRCLNRGEYRQTTVVSARKAELHVHREAAGDAHYVLVADAWPAPQGRTSVQLFAYNGYDALVPAIKAWANGKDARCPDMSKTP